MPQENYSVGYDQDAADFFGRRRANTHAAFFLPQLRPGMRLLDGGCGPGTITLDLAEIVAPGEVVGIDIERGGVLGARHADFGGFLLEPAPPPLDQFVPLFERLMLHNGADPRAGRHQFRWLTEAGFTRIEMSASYDCWTSTPELKQVSARFLESLVSNSAFAQQLVEAGLADCGLLAEMRLAFADWDKNPVSLATEAWTEAVAWKPMNDEGD